MPRFTGDLPERTHQFALRTLSLVDGLPHNPKGWHVTRQLLRSGTSIGANVQEANGALTDREFTQFCNIARREGLETHYWLRLCRDGQLLNETLTDPAMTEVDELIRIISSFVKKCRNE